MARKRPMTTVNKIIQGKTLPKAMRLFQDIPVSKGSKRK